MATEMMAQETQVESSKREAFAEKMLGVFNSGALGLMVSLGHRSGLFDLMADMPPATSREIAARGRFDERYVREWLGAMVTGGVIEYDSASRTYRLPPEHASLLTRAAMPENMATTAQWLTVLARVEDDILNCFRTGGGVPYERYHRFHEVMAEESAQTVVAALTDSILPLVPGAIDDLRRGIDVLDVGCGAGRAINLLAHSFPNSRFTGYDMCPEAVEMAREESRRRGVTNARFEVQDVAALGQRDRFDMITAFDAIHDQARPAEVLQAIHAALRPKGVFLMQDIDTTSHLDRDMEHPIGPFLYTISCMHCMTVSLAQGGAGLGTCWGEEVARRMLRDAGFSRVEVHRLPHDFINCYYVARK